MTEGQPAGEAIAVTGMSCRFAPDLNSPERLWEFISQGRHSVRDMPEKRWKGYAATSPQATSILRNVPLRGAYLDDIEGFDAEFFGISPREADYLDPQQRFMLELTWEALADAGTAPFDLRGTEAGVFTAANTNDYGRRLLEDIPLTGAYAVNGTTFYGIANRVSYFLDLRGPSVAVDTACAGSLTALHYACQSLRSGEIPLAIVGGMNIISTPTLNVALDGTGALSQDGRSKAFDDGADGYGRGEGAAVVVLKRLSDAQAAGDPVLALIRGSGVFQDGRSDGFMAPSGPAQTHMLREVYRRAGISPSTVGYVEAHGTGTPVGDGEELSAIAEVFGAGRTPERPCVIGSIKPNVGHVEGGSGITGVVKAVMALRHGVIPPSLHTAPTTRVDWQAAGLRLADRSLDWERGESPRRAGVSSYGVGGTIAHLVLEEAPAPVAGGPVAAPAPAGAQVFPVSSMSEAGLRDLSGLVADWLEARPDTDLQQLHHTLTSRRSHLSHRAGIVAGSVPELVAGLRRVSENRAARGVETGETPAGAPQEGTRPVWVFSGHGAQWPGMGRTLLAQDPVFAGVIDSLAGVFAEELGWTPREVLLREGGWSAVEVQALTFAVQVGLTAVWHRRGLRAGAVIGHSVGEIAAAVAAGALDLYEAARFACRRSAALEPLEGRGAMAMAPLAFGDLQRRVRNRPGVDAAISADPGASVLSGDRDAVLRLTDEWTAQGLTLRPVASTIAFHSAHMDAAVDQVRAGAEDLRPRPPVIPLYSSTLPDARSTAPRDAGYWAANLRRPVRFAEAVQAAVEDGHRLFVEISSHPVVTHSIREALLHHDIDGLAVGTLRRDQDETQALLGALAHLYAQGARVDWPDTGRTPAPVPVPAAAWQHRPYWIFPDDQAQAGLGRGHEPDTHSLLGGQVTISGAPVRRVWQTRLDMDTRPYPLSHGLVGVEVTPAASILNSFAGAAGTGSVVDLTDIVLRTPLAVQPARIVQVIREADQLLLATRLAEDAAGSTGEEWITHSTAVVQTGPQGVSGFLDAASIRPRLPVGSTSRADEMFGRMGVEGYAFPWTMSELRYDEHEQIATLDLLPPPAERAMSWAHVIDGALTISAMVVSPGDATELWMSRTIDRVAWKGEPPARIVVHSTRSPRSPHDSVDVVVATEDGEIVCLATGLRFAAVEHMGSTAVPRELVHEIRWQPVPAEPVASGAPVQVLLVGPAAHTTAWATAFGAAGMPAREVATDAEGRVELPPGALDRPTAVIVAPGHSALGLDDAVTAAWSLTTTVQEVVRATGRSASTRVWALTEGVRSGREAAAVALAPMWGVSRIAAGEHPEIWGGCIDVSPGDTSAATVAHLVRALSGEPAAEDVLSVDAEGISAQRLARLERSADGTALRCSSSGTVLITGGLGALGLEVARWLADRGARRLLLVGREGLPPRSTWAQASPESRPQIDAVLALESSGVSVTVLSLDITDRAAVRRALAPGALGLPPITGIVHAAGVVHDALVDDLDRLALQQVLGPKALGALNLHEMFPPGSLDFFVLFSSCGQFARLTGQAAYAAANSFMDVLAQHRFAAGGEETISIGWTAWRGVGLSQNIEATMLEANLRGLEAVSTAEAFRAWDFGDRFSTPYQAVMRILPTPPGGPRLPMFRDLEVVSDAGGTHDDGAGFDVAALPEDESLDLVLRDVREQVGAELNLDPEAVPLKRPLVELGMDSVMTVALRVRMHRRYGLDLPPTVLWAKPTITALSRHVHDTLRGVEPAEAVSVMSTDGA
ncbi:type I polyketide synthase [Kineosporia succinea]